MRILNVLEASIPTLEGDNFVRMALLEKRHRVNKTLFFCVGGFNRFRVYRFLVLGFSFWAVFFWDLGFGVSCFLNISCSASGKAGYGAGQVQTDAPAALQGAAGQ